MGTRRTSKTAILRQLPAARARDKRERRAGRRAKAAWYDPSSRRVVVELTGGIVFGFPAHAVPALAAASPDAVAAVRVSPGGGGLRWEALDADVSVPGLLLSCIGRPEKLRELARAAGQATSPAKVAAARANGRKGGRPRKAGVP